MPSTKQEHKNMKGMTIGQLPDLFRVLMIVGVVSALTYIVLEQFQSSQTNTSKAYTAIGYILTLMDNLLENLPLLGFVFFAVIIIVALSWYQNTQGKGKKGGA